MRAIGAAASGVLFILALAASAAAQFGRSEPQIRGVWNPVVGSGAVYEMQEAGGTKHEMQFAVVGSEPVEGKTGYWLEMASQGGGGTHFVMKQLVVLDGERTRVTRVILQQDDETPMELPIMAQPGGAEQPADVRQLADFVGTEDVTTPAGLFSCRHFRMKDGSGDAWISAKVPPWGMVKSAGREFSMTLVRIVTDAKTQIHGTPRRFSPPGE